MKAEYKERQKIKRIRKPVKNRICGMCGSVADAPKSAGLICRKCYLERMARRRREKGQKVQVKRPPVCRNCGAPRNEHERYCPKCKAALYMPKDPDYFRRWNEEHPIAIELPDMEDRYEMRGGGITTGGTMNGSPVDDMERMMK